METDFEKFEQEVRYYHKELDELLSSTTPRTALGDFNPAIQNDYEQESLSDIWHVLQARSEDFEHQMRSMQLTIDELRVANDCLKRENEDMKTALQYEAAQLPSDLQAKSKCTKCDKTEYQLALVKSNFARAQQAADDSRLAREILEKELEMERKKREHAEKERDAYSAAYASSLRHFEKWALKKQQQGVGSFFDR
jgi:hypothetical protein